MVFVMKKDFDRWQRLGSDSMIVWLDSDCESWIVDRLDVSKIGKRVTRGDVRDFERRVRREKKELNSSNSSIKEK